jgi:hypothetical protein
MQLHNLNRRHVVSSNSQFALAVDQASSDGSGGVKEGGSHPTKTTKTNDNHCVDCGFQPPGGRPPPRPPIGRKSLRR